jgi:hypothetical protein
MKRYKSIAVWDECHGFPDNETHDFHDTKKQAEAVCRMLERDGLGGERCHFPLSTRVDAIIDLRKQYEQETGMPSVVLTNATNSEIDLEYGDLYYVKWLEEKITSNNSDMDAIALATKFHSTLDFGNKEFERVTIQRFIVFVSGFTMKKL